MIEWIYGPENSGGTFLCSSQRLSAIIRSRNRLHVPEILLRNVHVPEIGLRMKPFLFLLLPPPSSFFLLLLLSFLPSAIRVKTWNLPFHFLFFLFNWLRIRRKRLKFHVKFQLNRVRYFSDRSEIGPKVDMHFSWQTFKKKINKKPKRKIHFKLVLNSVRDRPNNHPKLVSKIQLKIHF